MDLRYLPDDDALVLRIAQWHQAQWGALTGRSVTERVAEFATHRGSAVLPLTRVAYLDGQPVGNASLLPDDMDTHMDLSPWLASVYVVPEARRQGIGEALCLAVMEDAQRLNMGTLYLYTPDQARLYARLGWRTLAEEDYHGESVTLMAFGE